MPDLGHVLADALLRIAQDRADAMPLQEPKSPITSWRGRRARMAFLERYHGSVPAAMAAAGVKSRTTWTLWKTPAARPRADYLANLAAADQAARRADQGPRNLRRAIADLARDGLVRCVTARGVWRWDGYYNGIAGAYPYGDEVEQERLEDPTVKFHPGGIRAATRSIRMPDRYDLGPLMPYWLVGDYEAMARAFETLMAGAASVGTLWIEGPTVLLEFGTLAAPDVPGSWPR